MACALAQTNLCFTAYLQFQQERRSRASFSRCFSCSSFEHLIHHLAHRAMRFADGGSMVWRAGQVRIRERDSSKGRCTQNLPGRRLPVTAEEKSGLRADVCMSPAIQDDAGDVTSGIEPTSGKHLSQLCADLPFVIAKRSGQELSASQVALLLQRQTITGEKNFEREHDGR